MPEEGIEPFKRDSSNLVMARNFWCKGLIRRRLCVACLSAAVPHNPQISTSVLETPQNGQCMVCRQGLAM